MIHETTYEDENGAEWEIRLFFDYQPEEYPSTDPDSSTFGPACDSDATITKIERKECIDILKDAWCWQEWNGETNEQHEEWKQECIEAFESQEPEE